MERMERVSELDLADVDGDPEWRRIVAHDGRRGPPTEGQVVEGQFRCRLGYVLLLTEDAPYDEGLHIVLLDHDLGLLDQIVIGTSFTPGILQNVEPTDAGLDFEMFGYRWHLALRSRPVRWPAGGVPPGAARPLRRWLAPRYLALDRRET